MRAALARIYAIGRKELIHIWRDPRMMAAVLLLPAIQLVLFAYAISFDVKHVPTVVVDQDATPASRAYIQAYAASDFFDIVEQVDDVEAVYRAFQGGVARIAVVVKPGFARDIAAGRQAEVAVLVDGSEPNSAQIAHTYAVAFNQAYGQRIMLSWADAQGLDMTSVGRLEPRMRVWYNPERRSTDFLIPGLMVVIIMIVATQQSAVTLVRERDQGTEEQMLVSPLHRAELMVGKLLPWTVLSFAEMVMIAVLAVTVFGVPLRGDIVLLGISMVLFVFCALGLGLIISAVTPTLESANIAALLISFLPGFMLSGFAFPLDSIPTVLQWLSYAFPGRYMIDIARGVFLKGGGFAELWIPLVSMFAYAVVTIAVSSLISARRRG
jgi:ABC-2 type transport system permease protein